MRDGVVVDEGLCPSRLGERIVGDDFAGVRDEHEQQIDVPGAQGDALAAAHQAAASGIERERTKAEDGVVGAHLRCARLCRDASV